MTPQEKLAKIEAKLHSKELVIIVPDRDIEWLISRVKTLEAALIYVIKDLDMIGVTKSEIAQLDICRKALKGGEE